MNFKARILTPCLMFLGLVSLPVMGNSSFEEIERDVEVMSRALQAAAGDSGRKGARISRVEGTYLAHQGVIFRLYARGLGHSGSHQIFHESNLDHLGEDISIYVDNIVSDVEIGLAHLGESLAAFDKDSSSGFMIVDDFEWQDDHDEMAAQLSTQSREQARQIRELRREQSAAHRQYRDAQRKFEQDMERYENELTSDRESSKAQNILERAEQDLATAREVYRNGRKAYADKLQGIKALQQAERVKHIAALTDKTMASFCRYGTSLRALPDDEHITLVFDGLGSDSARRNDLYYVVTKKDFDACISEKLSHMQLIERATRYSF